MYFTIMKYYATVKKMIISSCMYVFNWEEQNAKKIYSIWSLFNKTITKTPIHVYISLYMIFINVEKDVKGCTSACQYWLPGRMSGAGLIK